MIVFVRLPMPTQEYDQENEAAFRREVERLLMLRLSVTPTTANSQ